MLAGAFAVAFLIWGQEPPSSQSRISLPHDWSHRHVVFSNPTTLDQTMRVQQDPRFWHQWLRRNVRQAVPTAEPVSEEFQQPDEPLPWFDGDWFGWFRLRHKYRGPSPRNTLQRDWAISLGPNATVGAGNYPAKFSFNINTANCGNAAQPDFVVFNTSFAGPANQASIVAYDNLYSGCGGTVPSTYWAYNTNGAAQTSVVLSLDGSQVAFVQNPKAAAIAQLVLLKWAPTTDNATSTNVDPINLVTPSQYPTCSAPCAAILSFKTAAVDTNSSPFYDYTSDALYVGDDNGSLHKFHPVLTTGTPAEVSSGWPVLLASGLKLTSPALDPVTGRVFVGSAFSGGSGAQLFAVNSATGAIVGTSSSLGTGNGIVDGPILDPSAGKVYVFAGSDNSTGSGASTCLLGGHPCAAVYQFATNFTSGTGIEAKVSIGGNGTGTFTMYSGAFDNGYYTSPNSTGTLYVCGSFTGIATPFRIPITAGVMSTTSLGGFPLGSVAASGNLPCGPLTEIFNPNQNSGVISGGPGGTDKLFMSTAGPGTTNPCLNNGTGGCVVDLAITAWQPGTIYSAGQEILDTNLNIQVVASGGLSGATQPTWPSPGAGGSIFTFDGSVEWVYKEGLGVVTGASWSANTSEPQGLPILDTHGNLEVVTSTSGTTGATQPSWPLAVGSQTVDGTAHWVNVGPVDSFFLPVAGGTSGIIVDNTVPAGTLAGASQVYFSPLTMGFSTCGASNGCAVQASQAGLK
jgi:hypothetical protein